MRASVVSGVKKILAGEVTTPEESHQSWLDYKAIEGWTYGEQKDFEKKTHPCFRPYHELPPEQRAKDAMFFAIVRALSAPAA